MGRKWGGDSQEFLCHYSVAPKFGWHILRFGSLHRIPPGSIIHSTFLPQEQGETMDEESALLANREADAKFKMRKFSIHLLRWKKMRDAGGGNASLFIITHSSCPCHLRQIGNVSNEMMMLFPFSFCAFMFPRGISCRLEKTDFRSTAYHHRKVISWPRRDAFGIVLMMGRIPRLSASLVSFVLPRPYFDIWLCNFIFSVNNYLLLLQWYSCWIKEWLDDNLQIPILCSH